MFYSIARAIGKPIFFFLIHPVVEGKENISQEGAYVLAGNHTKWLDPLLMIGTNKRKIHFLAKIELFHGIIGFVVKHMGAIPVDRKKHDKDALIHAKEALKQGEVIGIFPEGTINRTKDVTMPFKIGAVKMAFDTNTKIVPFTITGKYKIFRKEIKITYLEPITIKGDLEKENERLRKIIEKNLIKEGKINEKRENARI